MVDARRLKTKGGGKCEEVLGHYGIPTLSVHARGKSL